MQFLFQHRSVGIWIKCFLAVELVFLCSYRTSYKWIDLPFEVFVYVRVCILQEAVLYFSSCLSVSLLKACACSYCPLIQCCDVSTAALNNAKSLRHNGASQLKTFCIMLCSTRVPSQREWHRCRGMCWQRFGWLCFDRSCVRCWITNLTPNTLKTSLLHWCVCWRSHFRQIWKLLCWRTFSVSQIFPVGFFLTWVTRPAEEKMRVPEQVGNIKRGPLLPHVGQEVFHTGDNC